MKKILLLLAITSISLTSCSDDETPQPIKPQPEQPEYNTETLLLGKWNIIKREDIKNGKSNIQDLKPDGCDYDYFEIKSDGTRENISHDKDNNCKTTKSIQTWTYDKATNELIITFTDNYKLLTQVTSINTQNLILRVMNDSDGNPIPDDTIIYLHLEK